MKINVGIKHLYMLQQRAHILKKITESNHNSEASPADFNSFYLYKIKNKLQFGIKPRFKAAVCKNFSYKQHFKKSQNISIKSQIKKLRCCETVKDRTND